MAAVWQSASAAAGSVGGDPVVTKPSGTVDGDLLIAIGVMTSGAETITKPDASWNTHPNSLGAATPLFWKIASSEPANYTFVVSGIPSSIVSIIRVTGHDPDLANPIEVAAGVVGTGNLVLPDVTSGGPTRLLMQMVAKCNNTSFTPPGSATERYDAVVSGFTHAGGDETVGAGATGSRTWTPAAGAQRGVGYNLLIVPPTGSASLTETATLTGTGSAGKSSDASTTSVTATNTATGSAGVSGGGSLVVATDRSATLAGVGTGSSSEVVLLESEGSVGVNTGASRTETASLSGGGVVGLLGEIDTEVTVGLTAESSPGANANQSLTVGLTTAGGQGTAASLSLAAQVSLAADGQIARSADATLAVGVSPSTSGSRDTYADAVPLEVGVAFPVEGERTLWFDPPTQRQSMPDPFWGRFDIPVGISIVRVDGTLTRLPTPTDDELRAAGDEGTDFFRGGYRYVITDEIIWAELADLDLVEPLEYGYGMGPYGLIPYGGP